MAAPSYREASSTTATSTTLSTTTLNLTNKGDLIVVWFINDGGSISEISDPVIPDCDPLSLINSADGGQDQVHIKAWACVAQQSGARTISVTQSNARPATLAYVIIYNFYNLGPSGWLADATLDNAQPTPNLTPSQSDCMFFTMYAARPAADYTLPSGMTKMGLSNRSTSNAVALGYANLSSTAATTFAVAALTNTQSGTAAALSLIVNGTSKGAAFYPFGIRDGQDFGTLAVNSTTQLSPPGTPSTAAFGSSRISIPAIAFSPSGIASTSPTPGTPTVSARHTLYPTGRASTLTYGTSRINIPSITLAPSGFSITDYRTLTYALGPCYSSSSGVAAGTYSTPSYAGPSGLPVQRADRTPGAEQGWGVYLGADVPGATIPAGTPVSISWWARGTFTQVPAVVTDPNASPVFSTAFAGDFSTSTTDWRRFSITRTTEADWVPGSQRFRTVVGSTDSDWLEWSDVNITVNPRVGSPTVTPKVVFSPTGIAPTSAIGAPPTVVPGVTQLLPSGRASTLLFGASALSGRNTLTASGIASTAAVGAGWALSNHASIGPTAIVGATLFGTDSLAAGKFLIPGIASTASFGVAYLPPPVEPEWHKRFVVPQGPAVRRPQFGQGRGTKFLSVDAFTRKVTNEFDLSDVSYSFERNAPGEFTGQIDLYNSASKYLIPQQTYIVVERNGQPFWVGFLWQPDRSGKMLKIDAQGLWSVFGHRFIRDSLYWENVDRAKIVRDLVTYAQQGVGGNLGIAVGTELVGGDPLTYSANWWDRKSVSQAVSEIAAIDPSFTFSITGYWLPGNVLGLNFNIDPIYPRSTPHRLSYPGNVDDYDYNPRSPSPNFMDAFGGFDNAAMLRRSRQSADLARMVRVEGSVANRDLLVEAAVENLAATALKAASTPSGAAQPGITMSAGVSPLLGELMPGSLAEIVISDGPYINVDDSYALSKLSVKVPNGAASSPGAETVGLSFSSVLGDDGIEDGNL